MAATGPPPSGPWWAADTDTNTAGSPVTDGGHATHARLDLAVPVHVGVVEHGVAPAAHHTVAGRLEMPEYKGRMAKTDRAVLLELFNATEDDGGVAAAIAFDGLLKTFKPTDVICVQYHFPFDNPEPLSTPEGEDRIKLYQGGIQGLRRGFCWAASRCSCGQTAAGAKATYNGLRKLLEDALEKPAGAKVAVSVTKDDKGFTAKASVKTDLEKPGEKIFLRLLLVEDRIRYVGGNGVRYHQNVVRAMPGGSKGTALTMKSQEVTAAFSTDDIRGKLIKYLDDFAKKGDFPPKPDRPLDLKNLKVIALIQDDATGEVLTASQVEVK